MRCIINPLYYNDTVTAGNGLGHPGDAWGWVVGAGLRLNFPMVAQGDYFQSEVNYTQGALRYLNQPIQGELRSRAEQQRGVWHHVGLRLWLRCGCSLHRFSDWTDGVPADDGVERQRGPRALLDAVGARIVSRCLRGGRLQQPGQCHPLRCGRGGVTGGYVNAQADSRLEASLRTPAATTTGRCGVSAPACNGT